MSPQEAETVLTSALNRIAPEIDLSQINRGADLRDECDIDSMDFLNLVTAVSKETGAEIPEADYRKLHSFDAFTLYLTAHTG